MVEKDKSICGYVAGRMAAEIDDIISDVKRAKFYKERGDVEKSEKFVDYIRSVEFPTLEALLKTTPDVCGRVSKRDLDMVKGLIEQAKLDLAHRYFDGVVHFLEGARTVLYAPFKK